MSLLVPLSYLAGTKIDVSSKGIRPTYRKKLYGISETLRIFPEHIRRTYYHILQVW